MRHPWLLKRDLGWGGFLTFQLVVGGTVLSALVHPVFLALFAASLTKGAIPIGGDVTSLLLAGLSLSALTSGYLVSAVLAFVGLKRRRLLASGWVLLLMPLHWLLLSAAAWRAIYQLLRDPYRWEKTSHGHARTSRLASLENARLRVAQRG